MDYRRTDEEEAFLKEVEDFINSATPKEEGWLGVDPGPEEEARADILKMSLENWRKLGEKHWICCSFPKKYGGLETPIAMEMMLQQELCHRGIPGVDPAVIEADLVLQFGTEEQRQRLLPPIMRGEVKWSIGISEPNAGSDSFACQMSAVEEEDCYVLNGQKIWSSGAHNAARHIVYARTAPDKFRGISVFMVDLKSPGITIRQITQMTGLPAFCEVFYDNVRVPKEDLLGQKNGGIKILSYAFGAERTSGVFYVHNARRYLEQLVEYCKATVIDGQPLAKDPMVRQKVAQMHIEIEIAREMGEALTWMASKGMNTVKASSQIKIMGAKCLQRLAQVGQETLGLYGQLNEDSEWVRLGGRFRHLYLSAVAASLAGGTYEVTRNHIAGKNGLNLPGA